MEAKRAVIRADITRAWEEVHAHVGETTYVADFAFLPGRQGAAEDWAILIELPPFIDVTGPALFKWDWDRDILEGRRAGDLGV